MVGGDDVLVAGGGDVDVGVRQRVFKRQNLVAFHRRLQGADRIDLGDDDASALAAKGLDASFADVAVAADDGYFAADHHVGGAEDAVDQRMPAAIQVVELALGDAVIDVDGGEEQRAGLLHFVETMHAGGGLFADALHVLGDFGPALGRFTDGLGEQFEDDLEFFVIGRVGRRYFAGLFKLDAFVDEESGVAAVIDDLVGAVAVAEVEGAFGTPPVFFKRFALPGKDRNALRMRNGADRPDRHRGGGVVLRAEDVARAPAHRRAQGRERFDEYRRLDRHVQRAHDPQPLERLRPWRIPRERTSGRAFPARPA